MKRKTVVDYFEVVCISLIAMVIVSFFTVFDYIKKNESKRGFYANSSAMSQITVIIDAGHGGEDGGAVGISGVVEKDINLAIAQDLYNLFSLTDVKVVMTRTDDRLLYEEGQQHSKKKYDINNRLKIAENIPNAVFVSIHQNKFPMEKYSGLQVYYSDNNQAGRLLADIIQNKTVQYLQKDNNRQIKAAGRNILLLHRLQCPAVLVECGFLSNPAEEKLLCDEEYQKKIAFLIFSSIMESDFTLTYINAV